MRARVLVGEISRRSSGATRSGLIGNSKSENRVVGGTITFAGLQFQQPLRIDGDGVGLHAGRGGDRAGDDLALHHQTLDARVDQAGAKLRQVQNADDEGCEPGDVDENNPPRQT